MLNLHPSGDGSKILFCFSLESKENKGKQNNGGMSFGGGLLMISSTCK